MTPTIALKCRLDLAFKRERAARSLNVSPELTPSISRIDSHRFHRNQSENQAAKLLLSISNIVSREMKSNAYIFDEESHQDEDEDSSKDDSRSSSTSHDNWLLSPTKTNCPSPTQYSDENFKWNRIRSVSIDSPLHMCLSSPKPNLEPVSMRLPRPVLISPNSTPVGRGRPIRRASLKLAQKAKREQLKLPKMPQMSPVTMNVKDHKKKALAASLAKGTPLKTIGRKKFSWKNYPELEAFLIANREEYLRHSALNYTVQQKQYNNRLTEQLLELAAEHGYVFDEVEFSFVTVRDRIRCYFKSYVQSAKKRGITVGYAARKAGLLTDKDLRVEQEGQIIFPQSH